MSKIHERTQILAGVFFASKQLHNPVSFLLSPCQQLLCNLHMCLLFFFQTCAWCTIFNRLVSTFPNLYELNGLIYRSYVPFLWTLAHWNHVLDAGWFCCLLFMPHLSKDLWNFIWIDLVMTFICDIKIDDDHISSRNYCLWHNLQFSVLLL